MSLLPLEVTILSCSALARDTVFLSSCRRILGLMMVSSRPDQTGDLEEENINIGV